MDSHSGTRSGSVVKRGTHLHSGVEHPLTLPSWNDARHPTTAGLACSQGIQLCRCLHYCGRLHGLHTFNLHADRKLGSLGPTPRNVPRGVIPPPPPAKTTPRVLVVSLGRWIRTTPPQLPLRLPSAPWSNLFASINCSQYH